MRIEEHRSPGRVSKRLIEARRIVEVGAAQLAATNRSKEDLDSLAASIEEMRLANRLNRVDLFVEADIAFHDVIMHATTNMFIPFMFEPFGNLLVNARTETSSIPEIQVNAIAAHEEILQALTAGDPQRARDAMEAHMNQTRSRSAPIRPRRGPALSPPLRPPFLSVFTIGGHRGRNPEHLSNHWVN